MTIRIESESDWPELLSAENLEPVFNRMGEGFAKRMSLLALFEKRRKTGMPAPLDTDIQRYLNEIFGDKTSTSQINYMVNGQRGLVERGYLINWSEPNEKKSRNLTFQLKFNTIRISKDRFANIDNYPNIEGLTHPKQSAY
jgi:hypothetical protein